MQIRKKMICSHLLFQNQLF